MAILTEGQTIRDTYEVERFLGEGAFAEVYRVRHRFLGRQAMKVFKRSGMTLTEIEDILGEAVLLSRIGHPNIVRVFDANVLEVSDGLHGFFTMENVPGGSLEHFWHSFGSKFVPIETSVEIMKQVCRGMALAHAENPPIIHRDIKPQNILVGYEADGLRARVSDFGLAKAVNPLTLFATAAGTLSFKPPETFSKDRADSCAADVWALGVTLYLLLTDQLPYEIDPDLGWTNSKAFKKEPSLPSSLNFAIDKDLEGIILSCLHINPSERYHDARELLQGLESREKPVLQKDSRTKKIIFSEPSKKILSVHSQMNIEEGKNLAKLAIQKAKEEGRLFEAADIMEEAFNKSPFLREKYADQVRLWRCGISM